MSSRSRFSCRQTTGLGAAGGKGWLECGKSVRLAPKSTAYSRSVQLAHAAYVRHIGRILAIYDACIPLVVRFLGKEHYSSHAEVRLREAWAVFLFECACLVRNTLPCKAYRYLGAQSPFPLDITVPS